MLERLLAWLRGDVSASALDRERNRCVDAYDLVEQLPNGAARAAAWAAFALQTYADKLVAAAAAPPYVPEETVALALASYRLAADCLEVARNGGGVVPPAPPRWRTPVRSHDQLVGMRQALDALHTYLAFELHDEHAPELARLDARRSAVDGFWIEHAPPEIRGAIGDALVVGIDEAYALGRRLFETGES